MVDLHCFCLASGVPQWEGGGLDPGTLGHAGIILVKNASYFSCHCLHQSLYILPYLFSLNCHV